MSPLIYKQRYTTQIKREQRATYLKLTIHETIKLSSGIMLYNRTEEPKMSTMNTSQYLSTCHLHYLNNKGNTGTRR